jgi:hypothetical protein
MNSVCVYDRERERERERKRQRESESERGRERGVLAHVLHFVLFSQ